MGEVVEKEKKKSNGCLKAAGIGCAAVVVLGIIGLIVAYYSAKKFALSMMDEYVSDAKKEVPHVVFTDEEKVATEAKFNSLKKMVEAKDSNEDIILTERELNIYANTLEMDEKYKNSFYIKIDNNRLVAIFSVPMDDIAEGKFLNGEATLDASVLNGSPSLYLDSVKLKGEEATGVIIDSLKTQNLAENVAKDNPDLYKKLQNIESLKIENNSLIIIPTKK